MSLLSSRKAFLRGPLLGEQTDSRGLERSPEPAIYDTVMPTQSLEKLLHLGLIELLHGTECLLQTLQAQQRDALSLLFLPRLLHGRRN